MSAIARTSLLCVLVATAAAQKPAEPRTLAGLNQAFAAQRDALYANGKAPTRAEEQTLLARQLDELESFALHEAAGDDRWAARLQLAERALQQRQKERAQKAVAALAGDGVPGLARLDAAVFALQLGDAATKDRLVETALRETKDIAARIQLARVLMTSLRDVPRGEAIVAEALAAATDDEQRATVRWHAAAATREREDLPENAYYEALEALAKDLPNTRYGGIARDRVAASKFALGVKVFAFSATTVDGKTVASRDLDGKAAALVFAPFADEGTRELVAALRALAQKHAGALAIVLVAADDDAEAVTRAASELGAGAFAVCSRQGLHDDLFLRFHVETVPTVVALDRTGAITGLALHVETRDARAEFDEAFARALGSAK